MRSSTNRQQSLANLSMTLLDAADCHAATARNPRANKVLYQAKSQALLVMAKQVYDLMVTHSYSIPADLAERFTPNPTPSC